MLDDDGPALWCRGAGCGVFGVEAGAPDLQRVTFIKRYCLLVGRYYRALLLDHTVVVKPGTSSNGITVVVTHNISFYLSLLFRTVVRSRDWQWREQQRESSSIVERCEPSPKTVSTSSHYIFESK